jgi:uncharacterized membrane protein HdeD (DUF308 family)
MRTDNAITAKDGQRSTELGTLLIIFGVCAMAAPLLSQTLSMWIVGFLLIVAGIEQTVYAYRRRQEGGVAITVLLAVLYIVVGSIVLLRAGRGVTGLTTVVSVLFIIDGTADIVLGVVLHRNTRGNHWLFIGGVVSLVLGGTLFAGGLLSLLLRGLPLNAFWVISLFVGIRLVLKGVEQKVWSPSTTQARLGHPEDWPRRAA